MKKVLSFILIFIFVFIGSSLVISADTGPKPKTTITIYNLDKSDYIIGYATKKKSGPHSFYEPGADVFYGSSDDLDVLYEKYQLADGFRLYDISYSYSNVDEFTLESGYYWPSDFKLLIYDKINDRCYISEEVETYAFHSYFKCDFKAIDSTIFSLVKTYNYTNEIFSFIIRLIVTLVIEMLIALIFRYTRKSYLIILVTNLVTQIGLNLALNLDAHFNGRQPIMIIVYVFIELAIILVEGIIYQIFLKRKNNGFNFGFLYSIIANVVSFVLGMILWLFY